MRISTFLLSLVGLNQLIESTSEADMLPNYNPHMVSVVPSSRTAQFVSSLNINRRQVLPSASNMLQVSWNNNLASKLLYVDPTFYFQYCNITGPLRRSVSSYCGFNLMQMYPFNKEFPGFNFLIHDTFRGPSKLVNILKFRLRQINLCVNFTLCSKSNYTDFQTCVRTFVNVPGQPCSWAWEYGPPLMRADYDELACVTFKEHGPSAPLAQRWSFFCYANFPKAINDIPYVIGPRCANCPPSASVCRQGLCIN